VCVVGAVFITQASIVPNYRQAYENAEMNNKIFSSQIRVAEQATAAANYELEKVKDQQSQLVEHAAQAKSDADQALAAKLDENRKLTAINESQKAQLVNLTANAAAKDDLLKDAFARLEAARAANEKLTKEYARVEDLLKQEQSTSARRESQKKFDDEQIQELKDQLKELQARVAAGGAAAKTGETPVTPENDAIISGTITAVRDDMASINVGSAKGVKAGMRFTVYRGAQYVGMFQVQGEVGLDSSAGVIVLKKLDAAMGDKVTTRLVN
jgi:small-conductance mechanosensitive channel